jgi:hypothetical protein
MRGNSSSDSSCVVPFCCPVVVAFCSNNYEIGESVVAHNFIFTLHPAATMFW